MAHFIEINRKDFKLQDDISQISEKHNKDSYATQLKNRYNALNQNKVSKQAIEIMGETIGDMSIELGQKDNKKQILENKVGKADDKVVDELNKLKLKEISNIKKNDRLMNRLNKTLNNHNYNKN